MRAWFERYIDAFNRSEFAGFSAYYAEDIDFQGRAATLRGRQAVLDFYSDVKSRVTETIEVLDFAGSSDRIAAILRTTIVADDAWPDFPTGPLAAGARRASINFVFYDIAKEQFFRIRSAPFSTRSTGAA